MTAFTSTTLNDPGMRCTTCLAQYPQHKQIRESKILQEAFHLAFHEEFSRDENHYNKLLMKTTCGCIETRLSYTLTTTMSAGWLMTIQWFFPHPVQSFQNLPHPSVAVQKAGDQLRMLHLSAAVQKAGNQLRIPHPSVALQKAGDQLIHQLPSRKLAINLVIFFQHFQRKLSDSNKKCQFNTPK